MKEIIMKRKIIKTVTTYENQENIPEDYDSWEEFEEDMEDMMFPNGRDDGFDVNDFWGED